MHPNGFVFGKFYPPHIGHRALIDFAVQHCNRLTVIICASNYERISGETRFRWLQEEYKQTKNIVFHVLAYDESELPNTSVSDRDISFLWSNAFKKILPDTKLICTSEPYGEHVAEFMGIQHIAFDLKREGTPVSATAIRNDPIGNWEQLLPSVKRDLQKVIVINGTESTGKTHLSNLIAKKFPCSLVEEAGRTLIPSSKTFCAADLKKVANYHAANIIQARSQLSPLVIVDTDVYITQSYALFSLGSLIELPPEIYEANRAHLRLYLDAKANYVQDGTRLSRSERNLLDISHRKTLQLFGQECFEISGVDWRSRTKKALDAINDLLRFDWQTSTTAD